MGNWVVIEMCDGAILQCYGYLGTSREVAVTAAVELAMENNYEYGRNDARDILADESVLWIGNYSVYVSLCK